MSTTIKQYKELETLILKSDLAALLARWEFGRKLLKERGDAKRLPNGRVEPRRSQTRTRSTSRWSHCILASGRLLASI
jgi:hypothetical protein